MSIRVSAANLGQAVKQLAADWQVAQASWQDAKSREFAENYLEPLPGLAARTAAVIEEIDALLRKVRSDCE